jgi:hypothetical protein
MIDKGRKMIRAFHAAIETRHPASIALRLGAVFAVSLIASLTSGRPADRAVAAAPVTFTSVTPARVAAPTDFASDVRGYYWDFSNRASIDLEATRADYTGSAVSGGWFTGTTARVDPKLWLERLTQPGPLPAALLNSARYRYLTLRMCSDVATLVFVHWFKTPTEFGGAGFKPAIAGCGVYTFDLVADRNPGGGPVTWKSAPMQRIAIRTGTAVGVAVSVDYVLLTPRPPTAHPAVTAEWTPAAGTFDLYFDSDPAGTNATLIATDVAASTGSFEWRPVLAPGEYHFIAKSGSDESVSDAFEVNSPPRVRVTTPSYKSGPDYAKTFGNDPWDMKTAADIPRADNVKNVKVSGGIYCATNTSNDPALYFRVPDPIDPQRFFYASYRLRILGPFDFAAGSIARYLFSNAGDIGVTRPIIVYEGWQTIDVDLRQAALDGEATDWLDGDKVWLRFDPHQFATPRRFCIDSVRLTGDTVARKATFKLIAPARDADGDDVQLAYFYTKTAGATKGGKAIKCEPPVMAGRCTWNVDAVTNGRYYIYVRAKDGLNTTFTASQSAVHVQ